MNTDLEETLRELGPGYREMVLRMRRCGDIDVASAPAASGWAPWRRWRPVAYATAASIALALVIPALFVASPQPSQLSQPPQPSIYTLAYGGAEAAMELVRTQRSDGSWENDFLTRQNAAALRGIADASVAYRKALRYLRSRGLSPLTDAELRSRAQIAKNRW